MHRNKHLDDGGKKNERLVEKNTSKSAERGPKTNNDGPIWLLTVNHGIKRSTAQKLVETRRREKRCKV